MGAVAASAVSRISSRQNREFVTRRLTVDLSSQGTATNYIGATALGFLTLESCSNAVKSDNTVIYPAVVNAAGTMILISDQNSDTETAHGTPADLTTTIVITVTGVPA